MCYRRTAAVVSRYTQITLRPMKYIFSALFFVASATALVAQPLSGASKVDQLLIAVDSAIATNNWYVALQNLETAYEQDDELPLRPLMALMNLKLRDYKAASRQYTQVFRRVEPTDTTNNEHRFYFGQALRANGEQDEARTQFQDFLAHATDERMRKMAELELEGIKLYRDAPTETGEVALEILDRKINSAFSEYSPVLAPDGKTLYFSTWKATDPVAQDDTEGSYSQIFRATMDDKGKWGKAEALGKEVNRPGVHTANPSFSADGRRLYYNRIAMSSNKVVEAKIYVSDVEDDGWRSGNPVSGINADGRIVLQPQPGELFGNEVLFFVSDMEGGVGGRDIYYATYRGDGSYDAPVNLGESVNTFADENTPFYFDGTLYFSTTGYPTMGGKDLFYSAWNGSSWSKPENMGTGFNSTVDDQSLSVYGDGLIGYMTSNREGGRSIKSKTCCDDVYGFQIASLYANLVVGLFNEGKEALTNGTINLVPLVNGEQSGSGSSKTRNDGNRFDFGLELETAYAVVASHPGYFPDTVEINTLGLEESKEIQQVFFLKQIPPPPPPTEIVVEEGDAVVLENILYEFDKADILPAAEQDLRVLQEVMETYPNMVIELGSHTDSRGNADYNLGLSKRRAASARKWLIIKGGIDGPRIKTQGYGKTVPLTVSARLAEREDFLNEGDILTAEFIAKLPTEEQRERAHFLNRRTEFKVLEGPTEFRIRRDLIERAENGADRGAEPRSSVPYPAPASTPVKKAPVKPVQKAKVGQTEPPKVNRFSSLFGQKDISGLPILKFDKRELDLGPVKKGDKRAFTYTFTNKGPAPAKVMLIQACDCTTIEHDNSKVYQPGDSGVLKITFDSTEKDEDETITIDIFLEQEDKEGRPILEMVEYSFGLEN